ncbi:MAG TPA: FtsW/RodA/SpoVE family cell cycle protein [Arachidicoccus soli]|nr:FtsW/RodA/SpoVE family cell cycle protein [Arachidicoccus soli]
MRTILKYLKGDTVIWIIAILLMAVSLLCVYSFVPILVRTEGGSPIGYLFKHFIYILIGGLVMYWIHLQDPKIIEKLSKFIFVVTIGLLIFTFFFGVSINNATRWVRVPIIGLTFQSSDFAKLALIIFLSHRLVSKKDQLNSWKEGFIPVVLPIIIICGLIAKDNFSTAALLFLISVVLLFLAKIPFGKFITFIGSGIAILGVAILINLVFPVLNLLPRFDTWMNRIFNAYGDKSTSGSMQAIKAKLAISNGGFTGVGVGQGELKRYTPQAYADFFYSSFVEEFGFIAALFLVALYMILFYRIFRIALNAKTLFETYVAIGIGLLILSAATINMFVCTGIMPVTGQNMPFLSMGGSAMIMNCIALGIVLAISRKNKEELGLSDANKLK